MRKYAGLQASLTQVPDDTSRLAGLATAQVAEAGPGRVAGSAVMAGA